MSDALRVLAVLGLVAGNAFFVIGEYAVVGEPVVRDLLGDGIPSWLGFVIAFGTVTYLSVVFGELVPKALTLRAGRPRDEGPRRAAARAATAPGGGGRRVRRYGRHRLIWA